MGNATGVTDYTGMSVFPLTSLTIPVPCTQLGHMNLSLQTRAAFLPRHNHDFG